MGRPREGPASAVGGRRLAPGWLVAPVPEGIVVVGARVALDVPLPAASAAGERLAPALADGVPPAALASAGGIEPAEATELWERISELGDREPAIPEADPGLAWEPLVSALLGAAPAGAGPRVLATADELLILPPDLPAPRLRTLLRDFVAGLRPRQRRRAYSYAIAAARPTVRGDVPPAPALAAALEGLDGRPPDRVTVLDLRTGGEVELGLDEIGAVGAGRPHRLGTVLRLAPLGRPSVRELGLAVEVADHALADPARVESESALQQTKGVAGDRATAGLIARAEAAERCAAGDPAPVELSVARAADLGDFVAPESLYARNARQREAPSSRLVDLDPAQERTWARVRSGDGSEAWAPAEAVLCPFDDRRGLGHTVPATSNGLAAGPSREAATASALGELVERDAFMWTWVQRISRERVARLGMPARLRELIEGTEALGLEVRLVNLTLETDPVVLCGVGDAGSLTVGAGCSADPERAVASALHEAIVTRLGIDPPAEPLEREAVRTPADHEALYRLGPFAGRAEFLFGSTDEVPLAEIAGSGLPIARAISAISGPVREPLFADLTSPRTRPFHVVRTLAPGLVPISFGFDTEPLGMERLAGPRRIADGRTLGRRLDLEGAGPLDPHPFA